MQLRSSVRLRRVLACFGLVAMVLGVGVRWFGPVMAAARQPVMAVTTTTSTTAPPLPTSTTITVPARPLAGRYGYDLSWPQCDGPAPPGSGGFVVLGVTGGRPFRENRCLAAQWQWAAGHDVHVGLYANLAAPQPGEGGPAAFGARAASHALGYAHASGASSPMLWLDVESANHWDADPHLNLAVLRGAVEELARSGVRAGIYSTPRYWAQIMGGAAVGLPVWVASTADQVGAREWCHGDKAFTGGEVLLVQALPKQFDANWACDALVKAPGDVMLAA